MGDELGSRPRLRAVVNGKVSQRAVMGRDGSLSWWGARGGSVTVASPRA